jgi:opacity protein-like surface antigen
MNRLPIPSLLAAIAAGTALIAAPGLAVADDVDDYYEDEYDDVDAEEVEEAEPEPKAAKRKLKKKVPEKLAYARSGFYLYAGFAQGFGHIDKSYEAKDPYGVNFRIGARFQRYFGTEFEYQTFPSWNLTFNGEKEKIDVSSFSLNAKAYLPLWRFQPFGQFGLGVAMSDAPGNDSDIAFELRAGAGVEVFATKNFALSLTALYTHAFSDLHMTVGSGTGIPSTLDDLSYTTLIWAFGYHF